MNEHFKELILKSTDSTDFFEIEKIQDLWSGYGVIARYGLEGGTRESVVVKHIRLPHKSEHPRGWNSDISHKRKIKSYAVEVAWYRDWSKRCNESCYVPSCLASDQQNNETLIVLEDLSRSGFEKVKSNVSLKEMKVCVNWLAHFHATFMGQLPKGLWKNGTYWHLDTRPEELKALKDLPLKKAAQKIDQKLRSSPFQTFVHGDAKLANFCFSKDSQKVAAVDFQYVGAGCGMKDLVYFMSSCLYEEECERLEKEILDFYFEVLRRTLVKKGSSVNGEELEKEWRSLFSVAWADFHRFIKGWSPGHWKINSYSERLARKVVDSL